MSRDPLTPFSYTVLVLIGREGAGAHDLVRMARQGRVYASAAESQYYAEPKRLEQLGYLVSEKQPGRTHPRTHYRLTEKAYEALREWAREPVAFPGIPTQPIVRLLAADLVGEEPVLESLRALRGDIVDLLARLDVAEAMAGTLPHRERYLLANHRLARRILQAHLDWLDELDRAQAPRSAASVTLAQPSAANPRLLALIDWSVIPRRILWASAGHMGSRLLPSDSPSRSQEEP